MFPGASFHPRPRREWSRLTGSVLGRVRGSGRRARDNDAGTAVRSGTGRDRQDALRHPLGRPAGLPRGCHHDWLCPGKREPGRSARVSARMDQRPLPGRRPGRVGAPAGQPTGRPDGRRWICERAFRLATRRALGPGHARGGLRHPARRALPAPLPRLSRRTLEVAFRKMARLVRLRGSDRAPARQDVPRRFRSEKSSRALGSPPHCGDRPACPASLPQRGLPDRGRRAGGAAAAVRSSAAQIARAPDRLVRARSRHGRRPVRGRHLRWARRLFADRLPDRPSRCAPRPLARWGSDPRAPHRSGARRSQGGSGVDVARPIARLCLLATGLRHLRRL